MELKKSTYDIYIPALEHDLKIDGDLRILFNGKIYTITEQQVSIFLQNFSKVE